jgi:hypothetical protein
MAGQLRVKGSFPGRFEPLNHTAAVTDRDRSMACLGLVKIGKTLGIGTGLVQRVVTEQPRPFDVGVVEAYTPQ